jgi:hypothetical protein
MVVLAAGCSAHPGPGRSAAPSAPSVQPAPPARAPSRLVVVSTGVRLVGLEKAPTARLSLREALALRKRLRQASARSMGLQPGDSALMLHGFTREEVLFLVCRYAPEPPPPRPVKRTGRFRVEQRVFVRRSLEALQAFGIEDVLAQHEGGVCGVRVGMSEAELRRVLGPPREVMHPAAAGCTVQSYSGLSVTVCFGEVRNVSRQGAGCPGPRQAP